MAASATFALKAGVWFRRGRLLMVSPDSRGTACPPSGRNSTYRPVQISGTGSVAPVTTCERLSRRNHRTDQELLSLPFGPQPDLSATAPAHKRKFICSALHSVVKYLCATSPSEFTGCLAGPLETAHILGMKRFDDEFDWHADQKRGALARMVDRLLEVLRRSFAPESERPPRGGLC